ncbi:MAG: flagellar basal body rod protein FlgC [Armatimonadetes bacterium]|nr:flagellar basal body rod protein FlgC [Armatimonadota bacterium]
MNTGLNSALRISASGLTAERFRLDVISSNIANANTMKVNGKDPYRRRDVALVGDENGVQIQSVVMDNRPFRQVEDRSNPNADPNTGMVTYSNVEPIEEMVNMIGASRAYEANIAAFESAKGMIKDALTIGRA